jgi:predicted histone-like DNA-binding protein
MFQDDFKRFKHIFITYRITKRKNSIGDKKDQYIMQAVHSGIVSFEQICKEASERCAMSPWDVQHAASEIAEVVKLHLAQGQVVEMGELGRYKVGFNCVAEDDPKKLSAKSIKKFHLNFQPSKAIKKMLKFGLKVKREGAR